MKSIFLLAASLFTSMAFANEASMTCEAEAQAFAKAIIDVQAKNYGFELGGDLDAVSWANGETFVYPAYIYKASYEVTVVMDASCGYVSSSLVEIVAN